MKFRIQHTTQYTYQSAVKVSQNQVMLSPHPSNSLVCHEHRILVSPHVGVQRYRTDFFGNQIYSFAIENAHRKLSVTAESIVTVSGQQTAGRKIDPTTQSPAWDQIANATAERLDPNWLECAIYRFDSPRCIRRTGFREYAGSSFAAGRPVLDAALELTRRIHSDFAYDTKATDVNTDVDTVFELKKGVCQDFAHFQVSALRSLGLPARYVSGYLRTLPPPGKPRLVGADQSHAWISVYCGPDLGWIDFDPTNSCLCQTDHVPIAWGRDYGDVVPFRGVFLGGGSHELHVSVDVCPLDVPPSELTTQKTAETTIESPTQTPSQTSEPQASAESAISENKPVPPQA